MNESPFPKGFLWGAATAAYQVEGGIENCDWAKAAREGTVPVCGRACDHYNRFTQDFDLAQSLGHNAHRFSVEWARIEPREGQFDEREIEHYRQVLVALRERGLEPFVTLWHFTLPLWFSESGGWERKDAPEVFARYCEFVTTRLGDLATRFATMNEPIVYANNGWIRGIWVPFVQLRLIRLVKTIPAVLENGEQVTQQRMLPLTYLAVRRALIRAHKAAYVRVKGLCPHVDVSIVKQVIVFDADSNPFHKLAAGVLNYHWTYSFMNAVANHTDSIGLNYYFYKRFGRGGPSPKNDMGWELWPRQIEQARCMLARYDKPLYVSEAGLADSQDKFRAEYIQETVNGIEAAIKRGADVRGFTYWSLLDNYEWAAGFGQRFGLIEINYDTLERTVRPSALVYKKIIETIGPAVVE